MTFRTFLDRIRGSRVCWVLVMVVCTLLGFSLGSIPYAGEVLVYGLVGGWMTFVLIRTCKKRADIPIALLFLGLTIPWVGLCFWLT